MCIALVLGRNVNLRRRELLVIWLGVGGYAALDTVGFLYQQYAASALAALLLPVLLWRAAATTRRALILRRTKSQRPPSSLSSGNSPSWRRARMKLVDHGTHLMLLGLLQRARQTQSSIAEASVGATKVVKKRIGGVRAPPQRIGGVRAPPQRLGSAKGLPRPPPKRLEGGNVQSGRSPGKVRFNDTVIV